MQNMANCEKTAVEPTVFEICANSKYLSEPAGRIVICIKLPANSRLRMAGYENGYKITVSENCRKLLYIFGSMGSYFLFMR
jgi:hypothetical protein